jgi:hypothetical protein
MLSAARFFELAWRLPHYRGVMRDRVLALQREREQDEDPHRPVAQASPRQPRPAREPASREPVTKAVLSDPVMDKIFSFG